MFFEVDLCDHKDHQQDSSLGYVHPAVVVIVVKTRIAFTRQHPFDLSEDIIIKSLKDKTQRGEIQYSIV